MPSLSEINMAESNALEALTAELLGDVGKVHDSIKSLPAEISERVEEAIQTVSPILARTVGDIEAALASSAKGAEVMSKEQLNARVKKHAEEIAETFRQQMVPVTDMAPTIEKMRQDVELIAAIAKTRKPSIWPVAWTGAVSCVLAFAASAFGTVWVNKTHIQTGAALVAKQSAAYEAAMKTLPKRERDKAEAAYQHAYNGN